jgi:hypothetical protein
MYLNRLLDRLPLGNIIALKLCDKLNPNNIPYEKSQ